MSSTTMRRFRNGDGILTLKGHADLVTGVCFSPDGRRLASASHDHAVRVWDTVKGQAVLTLDGHTDLVTSVCFSPDGQRVFAWCRTGNVWGRHQPENVLAWTVRDGQP